MSSSFESTDRFFRPADVGRIRRNQRRVQAQRVLAVVRGSVLALLVVVGAVWIYRTTQSDSRFAIRTVEVVGSTHIPKESIDAIAQTYVGANLFRLDIAKLQREVGQLRWVNRIEIEKRLPDTLRIRIIERTPVALLMNGSKMEYVDGAGVPFAELSTRIGDPDLPLIADAQGPELVRCVTMLQQLRVADPQMFSRISEVRPVPPDGFALFDRELETTVYANGADLAEKWRSLYSIVAAERYDRAAIEYADLRFTDRVVIRPAHARAVTAVAVPRRTDIPAEITN